MYHRATDIQQPFDAMPTGMVSLERCVSAVWSGAGFSEEQLALLPVDTS